MITSYVQLKLIATATITGVIAIMTRQASVSEHRRWMAGLTARAAVMNTAATLAARNIRMRQTKLSRAPSVRVMAPGAIQSKQTFVKGRVLMTRRTGGAQSLELAIDMALLTGHIGMRPIQREIGFVMIKSDIVPAGWLMAS